MPEPARATGPYVGPEHMGEEILCIHGLSYTYPDGTQALKNVELHLRKQTTLAVVGPNGAGKTTLLKIVLGLIDDYRGEVLVAGRNPREARQRGDVVSWVPQRAKMIWDFPVTVRQVARMGLVGKTGILRRHRKEDLKYLDEVMDALDLTELADKTIGEVSGGQQQRAIIARALAPRPKLLMLDEPLIGIDQAGQERFGRLMNDIRDRFGVTLVIVSHDLRSVLKDCSRIACLNRSLHFHDSPSELTPETLKEVFRCDLTGLFPAQHLEGFDPHTPAAGEESQQ
ncbi:MAG: metal ABC transporter ATP-binding protein [Phycisphaerae bacterium]